MMMFPVVDVSSWQVEETEPIGRDSKVWLRDPVASDDPQTREHHWLFKPVVVPSTGLAQGEDWVEKVVSSLGALLGVACADVRWHSAMARRARSRGTWYRTAGRWSSARNS